MRVCTVLKHWLSLKYNDLDEATMALLTDFIDTEMSQSPELDGIVARLKKSVSSKKNPQMQQYHFLESAPTPNVSDPLGLFTEDFLQLPKNVLDCLTWFHLDPVEIARQLTLFTFKTYSNILVWALLLLLL